MAHPVESISSIKLAWAVSWSAFWTGFPFKLIVALLLLAGQVHPWEGAGLVTLLVVSVPIDIWAVGLTARTVFLERLGMEVRGPVGVSLWWQGDRKSTRLNSSHSQISYAVFCLKKKKRSNVSGMNGH